MFINFSNHPSVSWGKKQNDAASKYGQISELAFPMVNPYADEDEIKELAKKWANDILKALPEKEENAVMCQGEFSLCFAVTELLKSKGVRVVCACSERQTIDTVVDGKNVKRAVFDFCRFREM